MADMDARGAPGGGNLLADGYGSGSSRLQDYDSRFSRPAEVDHHEYARYVPDSFILEHNVINPWLGPMAGGKDEWRPYEVRRRCFMILSCARNRRSRVRVSNKRSRALSDYRSAGESCPAVR
jgi:hypothetical protein